jgi:hypothetical protein
MSEILTLDAEMTVKAKDAFAKIKKRVKDYHNGKATAIAYAGNANENGRYY